tara:strand:+ start:127 stop:2148 length:2022 start_codon:yes stop_codon:yes gene_type:complete
MFKLLVFLLLNSLSYGFMMQPAISNLHKPIIRNNILMQNIPDYDPSKIINKLAKTSDDLNKWNLNNFLSEVSKKHIESVSIVKDMNTNHINSIVAIDNDYITPLPGINNLHYLETGLDKVNNIVIDSLLHNDIYYKIVQITNPNAGGVNPFGGIGFIINLVVTYFVFSFVLSLIQQFRGGGGNMMNPMNAGKLESRGVIPSEEISTSFKDVAGCDEAKYELQEIVEFLKNPDKFYAGGAKVPKGVLLEGPPGTGKTLLARAVAGEASVSFIQVSASEFIQMFVGVGASRVRELFKLAKENTPCVIFIDEIDAVGRKRGEQFNGGGNDEREQTLNQILTNMDGFDKTDSIIVLAATNRADILDSALTRSGRFDRKVNVGLPDAVGRRKILDVHLRDKFVNNNTDLDEIAILTSGFSGADIENLANEAAILAIRQNKTIINSTNLIDAYEKITIGLPILSKEVNSEEQALVAYHEAGHTITALLFKEFFDVRKVTINANSNGAGGFTLFTPKEKYNSYPTKKFLLANLIVTMGGRAAEIILFSQILPYVSNNYTLNYDSNKLFDSMKNLDITAGASSDLKQADRLARQYIQLFGIESNKDFTKIIQNPDNPYVTLSEDTKSQIDDYVNGLTIFALQKALKIIEENINDFKKLANDLIIKKSVDLNYLNNTNIQYF